MGITKRQSLSCSTPVLLYLTMLIKAGQFMKKPRECIHSLGFFVFTGDICQHHIICDLCNNKLFYTDLKFTLNAIVLGCNYSVSGADASNFPVLVHSTYTGVL